jgi:hypothetical protein
VQWKEYIHAEERVSIRWYAAIKPKINLDISEGERSAPCLSRTGRSPGAVGSGVGSVVAPATAQTISNPMIAKAALVQGINDAWVVLALITLVPLLLIRSANPIQPRARPQSIEKAASRTLTIRMYNR